MKLLRKFVFQLLRTFKLIQKILEFNFFRVCIQNMIKYTINIYDKNNVNIFLQASCLLYHIVVALVELLNMTQQHVCS